MRGMLECWLGSASWLFNAQLCGCKASFVSFYLFVERHVPFADVRNAFCDEKEATKTRTPSIKPTTTTHRKAFSSTGSLSEGNSWKNSLVSVYSYHNPSAIFAGCGWKSTFGRHGPPAVIVKRYPVTLSAFHLAVIIPETQTLR